MADPLKMDPYLVCPAGDRFYLQDAQIVSALGYRVFCYSSLTPFFIPVKYSALLAGIFLLLALLFSPQASAAPLQLGGRSAYDLGSV